MERIGQSIRVTVGEEPIDSAALLAEVARPDSGATVLFLGTVRDHSEGKTGVTHLDYEVYTEQVERKIIEIVEEATEQWPLLAAVVEHRSGRVDLGEASVAVAVSSAHRDDAFAAARHIIDELKQRAPIWKKEFWPGGSEWSRGS
ncbi:MAG TPA: molybdenum cofactor biosynthesis protein MoaE [Acidimicrobiia bacterium]|jgi:molybdopterin synthase catalytic subunit|nr:molybdenum cofactor biosynthesis protein MoaE [Acidimicrobiia bacterium]